MILIVAVLQVEMMWFMPTVKLIIAGILPIACIANKLIILSTILGSINPTFSPASVCFSIKLLRTNDFKIIDLVRSIKNVKIKHEEISEFIFNLKVYLPGQKNFRLISNKTRAEFVNSSINFEFIQRFPKSSITKVIDFSIQHFKVKGDSIFFVKIKNLIIDKCVLKLFEFTCVDKHQIAITSIRLPYKRACEY